MKQLKIDKLAFYWRMTDSACAESVVPAFLPFEFSFLEELQLIIQHRNPVVLECLEKVYHEASNVGYLQEGHSLAEGYGQDFIRFILDHVTLDEDKLITEIGCGGAYILNELKMKGARVMGIDPSPIAVEQGNRLQIKIVQDFYPTDKLDVKSNVIIHYDVLEHVDDPEGFLMAQCQDLAPNGLVVFGVPDCSAYIEYGDISMVLHEHLNYFDQDSLAVTVQRAGFDVIDIQSSGYGGVLYCAAQRSSGEQLARETNHSTVKFDSFVSKHDSALKRIAQYISVVESKTGSSLGLYVPLRMLPYMAILDITCECRFFDDDPGIHHRFFDGYSIKVEDFSDLVENPVSHMIVGSFSFGEKIKDKIQTKLGSQVEVKTLKDFVEE